MTNSSVRLIFLAAAMILVGCGKLEIEASKEDPKAQTDVSNSSKDPNKTDDASKKQVGKDPKPDIAALNPRVSVLQPAAKVAVAGTSAAIQVEFQETSQGATWFAFASTDLNATSGGSLIGGPFSAAQTSLNWNTSSVAPGEYGIYIVLNDSLKTVTARASGSIVVPKAPAGNNVEAGNKVPAVRLDTPNGGEVIVRATTANISWSLSVTQGLALGSLKFVIDYSGDDGVTWRNLGSTTSTTFRWNVAANEALTSQGLIRVQAEDGKGGLSSDQSDSRFEIGRAPIANPTYAEFDAIAMVACGNCHYQSPRDYTTNQADIARDKAKIIDRMTLEPTARGFMPRGRTLSDFEKGTMLNYLRKL